MDGILLGCGEVMEMTSPEPADPQKLDRILQEAMDRSKRLFPGLWEWAEEEVERRENDRSS